jgi:hypothetical protein
MRRPPWYSSQYSSRHGPWVASSRFVRFASSVTDADTTTILLSLASGIISGVVVAIAYYLLTERSNRRTFRREKLYELKLETYIDLLSAADVLITAMEMFTGLDSTDLRGQFKTALEKQGVPSGLAGPLTDRLARTMSDSASQTQWAALGYSGPFPPSGAQDTVATPTTPEEAFAAAERSLREKIAPFLGVSVEAQKKVDRCYVRLNLLGVTEDLDRALAGFRRRLERFGFEGGVALSRGSQEDKDKLSRKWRKDWMAMAQACGDDLADTMQ